MALDQRQGAARDRAVADEQDAAVELEFPAWRHDRKLPLWRRNAPEVTGSVTWRKPKMMTWPCNRPPSHQRFRPASDLLGVDDAAASLSSVIPAQAGIQGL